LGKKRPDFTKEWKEKIKLGRKKLLLNPEVRKRMSVVQKGENNSMWLGGISYKGYSNNWDDNLRDFIRTRDNFICQECGVHQEELGGFYNKLDVHHIDYNKDNCDPKNLISLCRSCHIKTNSDRNKWSKYFSNLIIDKQNETV
jgi:hypothetical protein